MKKWREVKREYRILEDGREMPVGISKEPWIDFIVRAVSIAAIITGITGLWLSNRNQSAQVENQIRQQKSEFALPFFMKAERALNLFIAYTPGEPVWKTTAYEMRMEIIPVMELLGDSSLSNMFYQVGDLIYWEGAYDSLVRITNKSLQTYQSVAAGMFRFADKRRLDSLKDTLAASRRNIESNLTYWIAKQKVITRELDSVGLHADSAVRFHEHIKQEFKTLVEKFICIEGRLMHSSPGPVYKDSAATCDLPGEFMPFLALEQPHRNAFKRYQRELNVMMKRGNIYIKE